MQYVINETKKTHQIPERKLGAQWIGRNHEYISNLGLNEAKKTHSEIKKFFKSFKYLEVASGSHIDQSRTTLI